MKNITKLIVACLAVLCFGVTAKAQVNAVTLTLSPVGSTNLSLGDKITFNINISGLHYSSDIANSPALGAFDIFINYDSSILAYSDASIGAFLDYSAGHLPTTDGSVAGQAYLGDISFASPDTLTANQPASFTIGTITFDVIGAGTSAVSFDLSSALSSETSHTLPYRTTDSSVSAVPEPSYALAALIPIALVLIRARRRATAQA